jgi:outer membrane protein assembly factor BamB
MYKIATLTIVLLTTLPPAVVEAESPVPGPWPQFRGPGGMGVAEVTDLPVEWKEDSPAIRWKTRLPGYGVSSPIVSSDRVFVTTSFESRRAARMELFIRIAGAVLIGLTLFGWCLRWIQARRSLLRQEPSNWPRNRAGWADECLILAVVLCFLALACCTTLVPTQFERWLDATGRLIARTHPDLKNLVTIDSGVYAGVWLTGGAMALVGLAAATAVLRGFLWRVLLTLGLSWAGWKLYQLTPPDEWYEQIKGSEKFLFVLPGLALGWLAFLDSFEAQAVTPAGAEEDTSTRTRRALEVRLRNRFIWRPGESGTVLAAVSLLLLSALVFIPGNYLLADQGMDRAVLCLDLRSGAVLWESVVWTDKAERKHSDNSYATPTCAADGRRVLAFFGGILTCLDYDGNLLWQHRDPDYIRNVKYGSASSPIIVDNLGVVLQGKEDKSDRPTWLAAFDMDTGRERWRIEPQDLGEGYTTPVVHRTAENTQLLIPSQFLLNAYDLADGRCLWSIPSPIDQIVASPVIQHNILVLGGGTWGPQAIAAYSLSAKPRQSPEKLWQQTHGAPGCSSPVIVDDALYLVTDRGLFSCYDLKSGTLRWTQGLRGRHLASLVAGDGKLYALSAKGRTTVIDLARQETVLARNELPGKSHTTPALAPGCIVLRIGEFLYCVGGD